MNTSVIRAADTGELPGIQALLEACALPAADLTQKHLANFLVLPGEEGLSGCIAFEPYGADALLRSLAVAPHARKGGHGRALVNAIEAQARQRGIARLYLLTTTADAFFTTQGYARIERATAPPAIQGSSQFAGLCPSSSVCMAKTISSSPQE